VVEWVRKEKGTYSSRMKLPTERPPQLMPAMRLPAWLVLSRRPRSRIEMGLEWNELPIMLMEPGRRLSGRNSLPRRSMLDMKVGGWASELRAFAACNWLVRLDVWEGGEARGVEMLMGDADEAIAMRAKDSVGD
jgi:hypothetical protein